MPAATRRPTQSPRSIDLFKQYVIPNYTRYPVCLVRGEGSHVWDAEGNRYLDFFPGWGCNLLGHCPRAGRAGRAGAGGHADPRAQHLVHGGPGPLGQDALSERSFGGQAFFCNRGTEANEAAIKLARLHTPKERYKIITFDGGFHGRTLGADGRHGPAEVSRRARAAAGRLRLRPVRRPRRRRAS